MGPKKTSGRLGMDPYSKLLHRFYEPLILLRVLGQTRGTHTSTLQDGKSQSRRRRLLCNLSHLCDYDKGGDMTSSIALEDNAECYVFWIASNTARASNKNLGFLQSSLAKIYHIIMLKEEERGLLEVEFVRKCIDFAQQRVKKEVKLLSRAIKECEEYISKENLVPDSQLAKWLQQFIPDKGKPVADVCFQAYDQRKTPEFRSLEGKTYSGNGNIDLSKYESLFATVRHRLGRLADHVRAPKKVIEDSLELGHLFDAYRIRLVNPPPSNPRPQADSLTELHSILKRMLPDNDPKLEEYIEALMSLDHKFQITKRIRGEYDNKNFQPRVHAEVQILEHFCANQLRYVDNDHYIGCSKPACYCCHLYFRHHKSRPVEPDSHQKIYLNWGVPALPEGSKSPSYNMQRDLMNKMLETIRKDALAQIIQKAGPLKWHPDSLTGITISTVALPAEKVYLGENPLERQLTSSSYDSTTPDVIPVTDTQSYIAEEWSSSSLDNDNSSTCEPQGEAMGEFDSDSDSDGGVSL
ncbi:uncharacterized protein F4817DRAFT_324240 [Daldinia loculata]|uniref:uncharacterized protein n=1 Tax=Daldinia loculata TaxID=103429 RepID=UPI0020C4E8BE|nr:uncharacterized protein F4817DRAFT_324240 [Daldinia loculata]KAI1651993.1 hypothetical protein F4817DRAFT_324240 [Daldinia loculata]